MNMTPLNITKVRTRRPSVARIAFIVLALLAVAGLGYWALRPGTDPVATAQQGGRRGRPGMGDSPPVPVVAVAALTQDVPIYLDGLGTVQAFNQVQVRPQVDGPLIEVRFREGQDVAKGETLARIDPRPFQASLDAVTAKKQQDEATLANARLDAGRYAKLAATAYSSAQQADTARSQATQLEAQVRGDQAQIDTARTNLGYATIMAPIDGRVGLRQVDAGNLVRAGDVNPITVITQLKPISVVFTLPQQALPQVAAAQQAGAPDVVALRADGSVPGSAATPGGTAARGAVLERGKLAVLDNQVDPTTGTIKLKATFPNQALTLWPGGFVNVRLLVQTLPGVTTIPTAAVQRGPRGTFVFVAVEGGTVQRRDVKVGFEDDQTSVVLEGVKPGEQVVTDGAQRLSDGAKIAIAGPDGNAPDAAPRERTGERGGPGTRRARAP